MGTTKVLRDAREALDDAGLRGSFLVRELDTGDEFGLDADVEYPIASLVKVPLAVATLHRVDRGELDDPPAQDHAGRRWPGHLRPGRVDGAGVGHGSERRWRCAGPTGRIGRARAVLRHPHGSERIAARRACHRGPPGEPPQASPPGL